MSIDTEQTTPQTSRRRSGLAKLRGETGAVLAPPRPGESGAQPDGAAEPQVMVEPAAVAVQEPAVAETAAAAPESATAAVAEKPAAPPPGHEKERRAGRRLRIVVPALVVVVAVLATLVASGWDRLTGGGTRSSTPAAASADDRFAALRAARQFAVSFFTYDYRKIDDYFHRIEAASTGGFRSDFVSKEKILKTTLNQLKTVATGHVADVGAGIASISGDSAVALVAADMNASNAVTKNGQKRYRVTITLQRVHGAWLVSKFEQVI